MLYPGMTSGLVLEGAETVRDILEKIRLLLRVTPVLSTGNSGWLEADVVGAVFKEAFGDVNEYTMSGGLPELLSLVSDEIDNRDKFVDGPFNKVILEAGKPEATVSLGDVEGI